MIQSTKGLFIHEHLPIAHVSHQSLSDIWTRHSIHRSDRISMTRSQLAHVSRCLFHLNKYRMYLRTVSNQYCSSIDTSRMFRKKTSPEDNAHSFFGFETIHQYILVPLFCLLLLSVPLVQPPPLRRPPPVPVVHPLPLAGADEPLEPVPVELAICNMVCVEGGFDAFPEFQRVLDNATVVTNSCVTSDVLTSLISGKRFHRPTKNLVTGEVSAVW